MRSLYIGIDPGAKGGIASILVTTSGTEVVKAFPMPDTEREVWHIVWNLKNAASPTPRNISTFKIRALIEQVQGYVGKGANNEGKQPGSSAFKFGMSYGGLRMALVAASIPFEKVPPATWQSALEIPPRGDKSKSQHKNVLKARAQELFPNIKVTLATADALLLAHLCRIQKSC